MEAPPKVVPAHYEEKDSKTEGHEHGQDTNEGYLFRVIGNGDELREGSLPYMDKAIIA